VRKKPSSHASDLPGPPAPTASAGRAAPLRNLGCTSTWRTPGPERGDSGEFSNRMAPANFTSLPVGKNRPRRQTGKRTLVCISFCNQKPKTWRRPSSRDATKPPRSLVLHPSRNCCVAAAEARINQFQFCRMSAGSASWLIPICRKVELGFTASLKLAGAR